jgi:hypothetical protein
VEAELCKLEATVTASFADEGDRSLAAESDRQGIGGPARPRPGWPGRFIPSGGCPCPAVGIP